MNDQAEDDASALAVPPEDDGPPGAEWSGHSARESCTRGLLSTKKFFFPRVQLSARESCTRGLLSTK